MNKLNLHPVISAFPPSIRPSGKTLTICPPGGSLLGHVVLSPNDYLHMIRPASHWSSL